MGEKHPHDGEAIEELRRLSRTAKGYLEHHLGNSLCVVILASENNRSHDIGRAVEHIREDLTAFGCFEGMPGNEEEPGPSG